MPFQSWDPCFAPFSQARAGKAASWTCVWCSQGRPQHLTMNPTMGWKGSTDALFSFEMRCSSAAHCLQAAARSPVPILLLHHPPFCSSVFPFPLSGCSSHLPLQHLRVLWRALSLSALTRSLYCDTPGLTDTQDLPSRAGQKADFMSHEKMSRFKCFCCKGGRKGQIYFFLLKWYPRKICSALILLASFLFSASPLNKVNITLNNTLKFSVRNNFNFGDRGYTGTFDVLLMVKHIQVVKNIFLCWWSPVPSQKKKKS